MPRGQRRFGRKNKHANKTKESQYDGAQKGYYTETVRENTLFEKYYKAQGVVKPEEWDLFMTTLRRDLPSGFRLTGCKNEAKVLRDLMKERYFSKISESPELAAELAAEGDETSGKDAKPVEYVQTLPWYPDGLAFQINMPRRVIRKSQVMTNLHNFLVTETEEGNVTRQEAVSMIPPLLLDVTPSSKVLDMCAAPGSKTAQVIEMLHADDSLLTPDGFVCANDTDNKRCYLLVHQSLKRVPSPCCFITNHDACVMPDIFVSVDGQNRKETMKFDRVLCDVPCSSDGTLRKNADLWRIWSTNHAYNLHRLQCRIARRGYELLADGGLMVYSTCSLNPAEDEATIVQLLRFAKGSLELVDVSKKLEGLIRLPGLHTWKIMDKAGVFYDRFSDVPPDRLTQISETVFPPSLEEAAQLHLERCLRVLPHFQDTGGFFVAVLRKRAVEKTDEAARSEAASSVADSVDERSSASSLETEPEVAPGQDAPMVLSNTTRGAAKSVFSTPPRKKQKFHGYKEDPFVFLSDDEPIWQAIKAHFDVTATFPSEQLLGRCGNGAEKKTLYFVNRTIRNILLSNSNRLKFINAGVRTFSKTDQKVDTLRIRLAQEGLRFILPFLQKRRLVVSVGDAVAILRAREYCSMSVVEPEARRKLEEIGEGSIACCCEHGGNDYAFCVWRGKVTLASYISREARVHYLRLLGSDTTEMEAELQMRRKMQPNGDKDEVPGEEDKNDGPGEEDKTGSSQ